MDSREALVVRKTAVYSPQQLFAGSFLGGPIAAVYFLRQNFLKLDKQAAASATFWWGIAGNLAVIGTMPFLPAKFPNIVIPLAYSWTVRSIAENMQLKKVEIASSQKFGFQSNWRVFGLGVAFLAGTAIIWFACLYTMYTFHVLGLNWDVD